jgi:hypothetical protein
MYMELWRNDTDRGKPKKDLREKLVTSTTTNPIWTDQGVDPGLHSERPATNCLSHGMAISALINVSSVSFMHVMLLKGYKLMQ